MPRKEPTKIPTEIEFAWAAGFIEGDGHFSLNRTTSEIDVTQKELESLVWLYDWFGGSVFTIENQGIKKLTYYRWRVAGPKAKSIMRKMYPYMTTKRKTQIEKCLGEQL